MASRLCAVRPVGISVVYVEFAYGTEIYTDRQIVAERMQAVQDRLPKGILPQLAPISSIMGQILMLGMWSDDGQVPPMELRTAADWIVRKRLLTIPCIASVHDGRRTKAVPGTDRSQRSDKIWCDAETSRGQWRPAIQRDGAILIAKAQVNF